MRKGNKPKNVYSVTMAIRVEIKIKLKTKTKALLDKKLLR